MNMPFRLLPLLLLAALPAGPGSAALAAAVTTTAISDAFVASGPAGELANNNYGGGGALAVAAAGLPGGEFQSVIQFDLSGARNSLDAQYGPGGWSLLSVSLQLSSSPHNNVIYNEVAAGLFGVSLMQNNSWAEGTGNASNPAHNGITYDSLRNTFVNGPADQPLGVFQFAGGTSGANAYPLDLTAGLTADVLTGGNASLRLFAADNTVSYLFSSRAATLVSSQPQLVIVAVPEPGGLVLIGVTLALLLRRRHRPGCHGASRAR